MDGGAGPGAEVLSPGEADWPPELRLPPPAPASRRGYAAPAPHLHMQLPSAAAPREEERPPPRHAEGGFDDRQFLGSIMGDAAPQQQQHQQPQPQPAAAAAPVKRKRGRPPKNRDGAPPPAAPAPVKKKDEEVVCFICFDGGDLVVCDRRYV